MRVEIRTGRSRRHYALWHCYSADLKPFSDQSGTGLLKRESKLVRRCPGAAHAGLDQ